MTQAQSASANAGASTNRAVQSMAAANMAKHELHDLVLSQLDDDQAQEIVSIPLEGKSSVADFMVIASGRSTRQVASIAQKLAETVKHAGHGPARIEGLPQADWVLVDAGDVVVHLFRPEVRTFYNLERMWSFEGGEPQQGRA
ncbi:ribosome silencing factor [Erythrobacter sp. F6033]|uniref:ribosome silencing factor n=1 Tax=Erythrobacter sp. F6033 TaxID=2926401 RepID=UPI001FF61CAE|nr:ribosome silencing factor [Erythrobacter sp. F6033]MCK0129789.1 ribosome silencing factor [Erythrobacter sp. F6033]